MNTEDLMRFKEITTFTSLRKLFDEWINSGKLEENRGSFVMGYASLIAYPGVILTEELDFIEEVKAVKECYELMMVYDKDEIKRMIESKEDKTKLAGSFIVMQPLKRLLAGCTEFYMLDNLIKAEIALSTNQDITLMDGNDYAKQWNFIFNKGYLYKMNEEAYQYDFKHLNESAIAINKMILTPENKQSMDFELIKSKFDKYYRRNSQGESGTGCMVTILLISALGFLASCI